MHPRSGGVIQQQQRWWWVVARTSPVQEECERVSEEKSVLSAKRSGPAFSSEKGPSDARRRHSASQS
jgi:hypothetical protein